MTAPRQQLAPTGEIRVGLNLSNALLVKQSGDGFTGIAPSMAQDLARDLGVACRFVPFPAPSGLVQGLKAGTCDVAFLAMEASRVGEIAFTPAYLDLDAGYLAAAHLQARSAAEVDRAGVRIAVSDGSAYGAWLARNVKAAQLVQATEHKEALQAFREQGLEALAGLKTRLLQDAANVPGSRVLDGRFTGVQQAIGLRRPEDAQALAWLRDFVLRQRASGRVAALVQEHGITGVSIATDEPA